MDRIIINLNKGKNMKALFKRLTTVIASLMFLSYLPLRRKPLEYRQFMITRHVNIIKHNLGLIFKGEELSVAQVMEYRISVGHFDDFRGMYDEIFGRHIYDFNCTKQAPVIIDCGANIGLSSIYFRRKYPGAKITAIEAVPETFELLTSNLEMNAISNINLKNVAATDKVGQIDFFKDKGGRAVLGSTVANVVSSGVEKVSVAAERLSDIIEEPVDLLKIDVEGGEHEILKDLAQSGKIDMINCMAIEYHHHHTCETDNRMGKFLSLLEDNNFSYQIVTVGKTPIKKPEFQWLLIYAFNLASE